MPLDLSPVTNSLVQLPFFDLNNAQLNDILNASHNASLNFPHFNVSQPPRAEFFTNSLYDNSTSHFNDLYDPDINADMFKNAAQNLSDKCTYYHEDNMPPILSSPAKSQFSIMHFNIRSSVAHLPEIACTKSGSSGYFRVLA